MYAKSKRKYTDIQILAIANEQPFASLISPYSNCNLGY